MQNLADISGDGAVHQIIFTQPMRWVRFTATGTGTARVGGSNVSSSVGEPMLASATIPGVLLMPRMQGMARYQVGELYAYVPSGVTLSVGGKEGPLA